MRDLKRITPPAAAPVDLAAFKRHARIPAGNIDHDILLQECLDQAVEILDGPQGALNRAIVAQSWQWRLPYFPGRRFEMPLASLISVDAITWLDRDGAEQTVPASTYIVHADRYVGSVELAPSMSWPVGLANREDAVRIEFVAGYGAAADVPAGLKAAIKILALHLFRNPEAVAIGTIASRIPMTLEALIAKYVVPN